VEYSPVRVVRLPTPIPRSCAESWMEMDLELIVLMLVDPMKRFA
jgi:hypothetical protein